MADPFVAEIRIFPFNFAPRGWAFCSGQLLPISQNTALFSLLGTTYGGDGRSTFSLPNLQGSAAMHAGQGQALAQRFPGEQGGSETVTLLTSEMPAHSHTLFGCDSPATEARPTNQLPAQGQWDNGSAFGIVGSYSSVTSPGISTMSPQALPVNGGSQPHSNMQPYLTLHYCIALQGVFPARP